MIKKHGLWFAIQYYLVIPFFLLAVGLLAARKPLFLFLCNYLKLIPESSFYHTFQLVLPMVLFVFWFSIVFTICRNKKYTYKTGRSFPKDHGKYKRSYAELLEYFQDAEPHKLDTSDFKKMNWRAAKGIVFGASNGKLIQIPTASECNIAVFGPPGSGKSAGLAIINAITFQGSVLAVDIKGDLYSYVCKHTDRKIVRFCPDSPTALQDSVRFDPFSDLTNMDITDQKLYLESMATVLIADEGESANNYFSTRGRKLFQGITHLILYTNPQASFPDVIHAILQGNVFDWVTKAIDSNCEPAKELLSSFYGNNEKNVSSAYDALTTALVHFSNPVLDVLLSKSKHSLSLQTLENGFDVYLQISQEHLEAYAPLFTLLIQTLSTACTKRPDSSTGIKNRPIPILMLLDEFPQLTFSYQLINTNLSTLRSKSVICMLLQQNLSQLEYRFQQTGARSILGNCNYQIILGSNDINSSKTFSDTFGIKKVLKISNSETTSKNDSTGRSIQEATEKVFPPEYFGDLPAQNKMIIYFKGKYLECNKLNCYKD